MKINCVELAKECREKVREEVALLPSKPRLAIVQVGDRADSNTYIRNKIKAIVEVGCEYVIYKLNYADSEEDVLTLIDNLNVNPMYHGIMVQSPLPKHINMDHIKERIFAKKDVDCFNPYNVGKMFSKDHVLEPCTPRGIIRILEHALQSDVYKECFTGLKVVIAGRSELVSRPLAELLLQRDCTVEMIHSKTQYSDKSMAIKTCHVFISAIGKPNFWYTGNFFRSSLLPLVAMIDVGINTKDGKLCGDIDPSIYPKARRYTTVPGGVGPMTVAMLLENLVLCYKMNRGEMKLWTPK